jgi:hypothetical protein
VTAFAIVMGIGRLATILFDFGFFLEIDSEQLLTLLAIAVCNTFLCLIVGISVLVRYRLFYALLFGAMAILVVCGLEILVVSLIDGPSYDFPTHISITHATTLVLMVATLLILRMGGLRFWSGR